jgi:hypothetical protein
MNIGITLDVVIFLVLIGYIWKQEQYIKVRDRQFRMMLARLNQLTNRGVDDFASPIDEMD